jgi:hypothetical protein
MKSKWNRKNVRPSLKISNQISFWSDIFLDIFVISGSADKAKISLILACEQALKLN